MAYDGIDEEASIGSRDSLFNDNDESQEITLSTLSPFERLIAAQAPILESLLLQLPTTSIIQLFHTSRHLSALLLSCPIAWQYLSFRVPGQGDFAISAGAVTPSSRQSKANALDQFLMNIVAPFGTCLKNLDLDNTAVSGMALMQTVLLPYRQSLEHLSVRGCKNVSLKYHIVPFLQMQLMSDPLYHGSRRTENTKLALKSLYTYRCRHHRRRPYLPSSLQRKDSDSEPTHTLIDICHKLGIWTDTAWCTTPGSRCLKRRDYANSRMPGGATEVWAPFDRLWRSSNYIGPLKDHISGQRDGRFWEELETGWDGEALGVPGSISTGEGKTLPTHLRQTHRVFVEEIQCDACGEEIIERCEQCSIRMHCMGCRRTLCASCAFDRPLKKRAKLTTDNLWWALGYSRSPNLMREDTETAGQNWQANPGPPAQPANTPPPKIKFHWCCTEPTFSPGGGVTLSGMGSATTAIDKMRAAPLPKGKGWEDPDFTGQMPPDLRLHSYDPPLDSSVGHALMLGWLLGSPTRKSSKVPRNLCQDCYDSSFWKVNCEHCRTPLCQEHELRGLKMRICGYRDLTLEKILFMAPDHDAEGKRKVREIGKGLLRHYPTDSAIYVKLASLIELPEGDEDIGESSSSGEASSSSTQTYEATSHGFDGSADAGPSSAPTSRTVSRASSQSSPEHPMLPDIPPDPKPWNGCAAFFCPPYRLATEARPRCTADIRECCGCGKYVCQRCLTDNEPCDCSYCREHFNCPNCYRTLEEGLCRKAREEEERLRKEREILQRKEEEAFAKAEADHMADLAGQFFEAFQRELRDLEQQFQQEHEGEGSGAGPSSLQQ
ncbi:MAG: hypothetical protein M1834_006776 [Cirrosporium novae-zelandiae]|nr:MAG: hypothetical protein M1834_006776 [Cirrosporium novae-zelandiae]